jgi:UDP-N-acetylenolpyruvoylglucosamine reductase
MKYRLELTIDKPRRQVWQAFTDREKIKVWQPALSDIEPIKGIPGQVGSESKLNFKENEREFSLIEKITQRQEPETFSQLYENSYAVNTVKNSFIDHGESQTLWITETEYKFKTLLMKMIGPVYKRNFAVRTQRDMERFKEVVENK